MAEATRILDGATQASSRIETTLGGLRQRYRRWRLYRNTLHELRAMSDRELSDLGLSRDMLQRIAAESVADLPKV